MRFDENASWSRNLPDIFTIITNKHSSFKILSQTQLWSGPMRALVTQALCLHISSYECSHCPDHDWVWQQRGCVISSHSVDTRLCLYDDDGNYGNDGNDGNDGDGNDGDGNDGGDVDDEDDDNDNGDDVDDDDDHEDGNDGEDDGEDDVEDEVEDDVEDDVLNSNTAV